MSQWWYNLLIHQLKWCLPDDKSSNLWSHVCSLLRLTWSLRAKSMSSSTCQDPPVKVKYIQILGASWLNILKISKRRKAILRQCVFSLLEQLLLWKVLFFFTLDFCFLIHLHKTNRFGTSFVSLAGTCVCVSAGESGSYLQGNPTLLNSESVCGCRKCEDHSVWATWRAPTQYCSSRLQTGTHRLPVHWSKSNEPPHISFRISNAHVSAHLGFLQKLNIFSHKIKKHSLHSQNFKKKWAICVKMCLTMEFSHQNFYLPNIETLTPLYWPYARYNNWATIITLSNCLTRYSFILNLHTLCVSVLALNIRVWPSSSIYKAPQLTQ